MIRLYPKTRMYGFVLAAIGIFLSCMLIDFFYFKSRGIKSDLPALTLCSILANIVLCGVAGIYRVSITHPKYLPGYLRWLETTPWTFEQPLPFGPVRLVWTDALDLGVLACVGVVNVLAAFTLLSPDYRKIFFEDPGTGLYGINPFTGSLLVAIAMITVFFTAYDLILWLTLRSERAVWTIVAYLIPLIAYCLANPPLCLALLAMITFLLQWGHLQALRKIPWGNPAWTRTASEQSLEDARERSVIGGLTKILGPWNENDVPRSDWIRSLRMSTLIAWWIYVPLSFVVSARDQAFVWTDWANVLTYGMAHHEKTGPPEDGLITFMLCYAFPFAVALIRIGVYTNGGYNAPIPYFSRLWIGRLIIPDFDQVFVGPIAIVIVGATNGLLLHALGFPDASLPFFHIALVFGTAFSAGPTIEAWRLTGGYSFKGTPILDIKIDLKTGDVQPARKQKNFI